MRTSSRLTTTSSAAERTAAVLQVGWRRTHLRARCTGVGARARIGSWARCRRRSSRRAAIEGWRASGRFSRHFSAIKARSEGTRERNALAALVERHHEQLLRVVGIRLGRGMRAFLESGDVVQESYQALIQEFGRLELARGDDLVQWLARVATNRIRDAHDRARAAKRDVRRERPLDPADPASGEARPALAASQTSTSQAAWRSEVREALDEAVAALPEDWREAILLRDFCGASWERIAAELGRPLHACQQLHQRAWIRVRRLAAPRLGGAGA